MSTAFEMELKYRQLKEEIAYYKQLVEKRGWLYAIAFGALVVLIIECLFFLAYFLTDRPGFYERLMHYKWENALSRWVSITLFYYFWHVGGNIRKLRRKTKELHALLLNNPSLEKTAA